MWRPGDFPRLRGTRAGVPTRTKIPVKCRRTWPGVNKPSVRGCSHGMRTSVTNGRANHSCQQAAAISQDQRSAAAAFRGRTVVGEALAIERQHLLPLAREGFDLVEVSFGKVNGLGCVKARTNAYSTPLAPAMKAQIKLTAATVEVWYEG